MVRVNGHEGLEIVYPLPVSSGSQSSHASVVAPLPEIAVNPSLRWVLDQYSWLARQGPALEHLGNNGGFSGATFWKLSVPEGDYCLRRWPAEHPSDDRLTLIHSVLWHVWQQGFDQLALPLKNNQGRTFVQSQGHLWELSPWLAGEADFPQNPSDGRLRAALRALGDFHNAASTYQGTKPAEAAPSMRDRSRLLDVLLTGQLADLRRRAAVHPPTPIDDPAERLLELFARFAPSIAPSLRNAAAAPRELAPCLRDIWSDHVLFQDEEVVGFVDFGALRFDDRPADIARLLGSLAGDDNLLWQIGLQAYAARRTLSDEDRRRIAVFDQANVLLSGINWLRWTYLENRTFDDYEKIVARLRETIGRLEHLIRQGPDHHPAGPPGGGLGIMNVEQGSQNDEGSKK